MTLKSNFVLRLFRSVCVVVALQQLLQFYAKYNIASFRFPVFLFLAGYWVFVAIYVYLACFFFVSYEFCSLLLSLSICTSRLEVFFSRFFFLFLGSYLWACFSFLFLYAFHVCNVKLFVIFTSAFPLLLCFKCIRIRNHAAIIISRSLARPLLNFSFHFECALHVSKCM